MARAAAKLVEVDLTQEPPETAADPPGATAPAPDFVVPDHIEPPFDRLYTDLIHEVIAVRQAATPADLQVIQTAVTAAQYEAEARMFAKEAEEEGDRDGYMKFCRLMQTHARAKSQALSALHLIGDRLGASGSRRKAMAATNDSVLTGDGKKGGRWRGLL